MLCKLIIEWLKRTKYLNHTHSLVKSYKTGCFFKNKQLQEIQKTVLSLKKSGLFFLFQGVLFQTAK